MEGGWRLGNSELSKDYEALEGAFSSWTLTARRCPSPWYFWGIVRPLGCQRKALFQKPKSSTERESNEQDLQRLEEKLFQKSVLTFAASAFPTGPVIERGWRYLLTSQSAADSPLLLIGILWWCRGKVSTEQSHYRWGWWWCWRLWLFSVKFQNSLQLPIGKRMNSPHMTKLDG